jgi:hypothetical protein
MIAGLLQRTLTISMRMAVTIAAATVLASLPATAQKLPDKNVVKEWVANAEQSSELSSYTGAPYHFVAHFHYTFADKSVDGIYEVLWAAPDRFRVEFRAGNVGETDVVLGDKKYVLRNTPTMSYAMWSVSGLLQRANAIRVPAEHTAPSTHNITATGDGASRQICAEIGPATLLVHQMCFDAATFAIVSDRTHSKKGAHIAGGSIEIDRTDFMQLDGTRIPRHVVRQWGPETIDATVEKWERVDTIADDLLTPPEKSVPWDWCASPIVDTSNMPAPTLAPQIDLSHAWTGAAVIHYFAFYRVVDASGNIEQSTALLGSPDSPAAAAALKGRAARYFCNGKPIRYESVSIIFPALVAFGM